jgi:hypothetical protein
MLVVRQEGSATKSWEESLKEERGRVRQNAKHMKEEINM